MFVLLIGIFLSLDNYAGKLGRSRVVYTVRLGLLCHFFHFPTLYPPFSGFKVIFGLTNLVSVTWLLYLFVDVSAFRRKLNSLKPMSENYNNDIYDITKDTSGKPAFKSQATGAVYATTKEIAAANPEDRGKREDYEQKDQGKLNHFPHIPSFQDQTLNLAT